jgi:hypothetical protein
VGEVRALTIRAERTRRDHRTAVWCLDALLCGDAKAAAVQTRPPGGYGVSSVAKRSRTRVQESSAADSS